MFGGLTGLGIVAANQVARSVDEPSKTKPSILAPILFLLVAIGGPILLFVFLAKSLN